MVKLEKGLKKTVKLPGFDYLQVFQQFFVRQWRRLVEFAHGHIGRPGRVKKA